MIGRHDVITGEIGKGITVPTHHQCCTCQNYGVLRRVPGEGQFLDWYDPTDRGLLPVATEPWPYTSKSPFCLSCWAAIKEKRK